MLVTNSNSKSLKDKEKEKDNEIIVKSIVYGSVAFGLVKKQMKQCHTNGQYTSEA